MERKSDPSREGYREPDKDREMERRKKREGEGRVMHTPWKIENYVRGDRQTKRNRWIRRDRDTQGF